MCKNGLGLFAQKWLLFLEIWWIKFLQNDKQHLLLKFFTKIFIFDWVIAIFMFSDEKKNTTLKSRLIFNIFYLFLNVYKQSFHTSHVRTTQKVKGVLMWNRHHIIFIWRQRYWQIFRSALVSFKENSRSHG